MTAALSLKQARAVYVGERVRKQFPEGLFNGGWGCRLMGRAAAAAVAHRRYDRRLRRHPHALLLAGAVRQVHASVWDKEEKKKWPQLYNVL